MSGMQKWSKILGVCCAATACAVALACGTHDSGGRAVFDKNHGEIQEFDGHSRYSIKVYVPGEGGEYQLMELSPQNAAYAQQQQEKASTPQGQDGNNQRSEDSDSEGFSQKEQRLRVDADGTVMNFANEPSLHQLAAWVYEDCGISWVQAHRSESNNVAWPVEAGGSSTSPFIARPLAGAGKWLEVQDGNFVNQHWYVARIRRWQVSPLTNLQGPTSTADVLSSCDSVLAMQSQMLCTAGRLAEMAESFSTIRLEQAEDGSAAVLVPPQAAKDRFLIRRLALESLASFAHAGEMYVGNLQKTCGEKLSYSFKEPIAATNEWWLGDQWIFDERGQVPFRGFVPPAAIQDTPLLDILSPRVELYVAQYRRAAEMLDGILDNIASDGIAQAEALRAEGGIAAAWGLVDEADVTGTLDTLPNSLRGAASLLVSRLEVDSTPQKGGPSSLQFNPPFHYLPVQAPACSGAVPLKDMVGELDVFDLDKTFIAAAAADMPPKTLGQQRARSIVERLGIVIEASAIQSGGLLPMIKQQMGIIDAYNAGMGAYNVSPSTNQGFDEFIDEREQMYDRQLDGLTDADFVYALRVNLALYAQLSGGRFDVYPPDVINNGAGLRDCGWLRGQKLSELTQGSDRGVITMILPASEAYGLRFSGLSRTALSQLGYSRFARASAASQCNGNGTASEVVGTVYSDVASLAFKLFEQGREILSLQDSTERTAHPEWKELLRLETQYFAKHSIDGITQVAIHNVDQGTRGRWTASVYGSPEIAGTPLDELPLAVVYGYAWVAECAAGLRTLCDDQTVANAQLALASISGNQIYEEAFAEGGASYQFIVDDHQTPIVNANGIADGKLMYLVRKPTAAAPGVILGAFRPRAYMPFRGVSHNVREQLDRVFSRSHAIGSADKCLEANYDGVAVQSCLPGIEENQYVPLANELTSVTGEAEDSWKHYLGLARESAAKADELGRQIIELGTTRDLRAEAAAEELAGICGGGVNLGRLNLDGGVPSSDEDLEFNECISPPTVPVVFFQGHDVEDDVHLAAIQNHHSSCGDCDEEEACTGEEEPGEECCIPCDRLRAEGLGMEPPPAAAKPPGIPGCDELMGEAELVDGVAASPLPHFVERLLNNPGAPLNSEEVTWFRKNVTRDHYREGSFAAALNKLSLRESKETKTWGLFLNGSIPFLAGKYDDNGALTIPEEEYARGPYMGFPLCLRTATTLGANTPEPVPLAPGETCSDFAMRVARALGFAVNDEGNFIPPLPPVSQIVEYERALRRMAEGGLWAMARVTGGLPANTFKLLLPVKNFAESTVTAPWPTLYARSVFEQVADTNHWRLASAAGTFPSDREFLGLLDPVDDWFPGDGLRGVVHENEDAGFLMLLTANAGKFFGSMASPETTTETISTSQFLDYALDGDNQAFWDIVRDPLDDGNAPNGVDLYRDGELYGVMLRRDCRKDKTENKSETIQDSYGNLFPWASNHDGMSTVLWTYERCADERNEPYVPNRPSVQLLGRTDFKTHGECSGSGSSLSCTSGDVDFRRENDFCNKVYEQYTSCKEQAAYFFTTLMSPTIWPPAERVHTFIEPGNNQQAAVAGMGLLSCIAEGVGGSRNSAAVPQITDPAQVPMLSRWIDQQAELLASQQSKMFVEDVPQRVVDYYKEIELNGAVGKGASSDEMLAMAQALEAVYSGFSAVYSGVRAMGDAVRNAEIAMTSEELRRDAEKARLAIQRINTIGNVVSSTLRSAAAAGSGGAMSYATGGFVSNALTSAAEQAQAIAGIATLPKIDELEENAEQQYDNSIDGVLQSMTEAVQRGYEQALDGMTQIRTGRLEFLRSQNALGTLQNQAMFAAAKASGADAVDLDGDGSADEIPVNIVYRRQFDVLKRRYEAALDSAKRYAYLARLSAEQKLGVRMESLDEDIGPLSAPSVWHKDICYVSGVDYAQLRTLQQEGEVTPEEEVLDKFADQYVGDYIDQLEQFVEYYNIQYPFHEDDDAAVLSIRDDLVYGNGMCRRAAKNLLYHSDALAARNGDAEVPEKGQLSLRGWKTTGCEAEEGEPFIKDMLDEGGIPVATEVVETEGRCLRIRDEVEVIPSDDAEAPPNDPGSVALAYLVDSGNSLEPGYIHAPKLAQGLSLISFEAMHTETVPTSEPEELTEPPVEIKSRAPLNVVYQTVEMEKGAFYRLSWLAQTRALMGAPAPSDQAPYRVMVTDEEWSPLFLEDFKASESEEGWGERIYREVYAPADGYYHVAFVPLMKESDADPFNGEETSSQSLGLSSVQLEYFEPRGPVDYEATTGTRMITKMDCGAGNGQLFRDSFVRRCYQGDCYYELTKPIQLTDNDIDGGRWDLPGIAEQNYNYRHRTVALNVVGTGVLDCDGANPGCFSNGFVEYDLVHTAYNTALRDYGGEPRCFNFGEAEIKHGKALATERYLGIPMSSDDQGLIGGADFTKGAFHGRPLTGMYTLRIYESPQMRWENVEDIQLVLNYRYWSRVKRNPN